MKHFGGVLVAIVGMLGLAVTPASGADFSISFDGAVINPGGVTAPQRPGVNGFNDVDPDPVDVVELSGTVSESGEVTIPAGGVSFKRQTRTIKPFRSFYRIDWSSPAGFTGRFDQSTGELNLTGDLKQQVTELSNVCETGPIPVTLSTEAATASTTGQRFTEGLDGEGTLVGSWNAESLVQSGPDCDVPILNCLARMDLARNKGDIALATGTSLRAGIPSMSPCIRIVHLKEVVYSKAGRIMLERGHQPRFTTLTNGGRFFGFQEPGDLSPVISPDSNRIAFIRSTPVKGGFGEYRKSVEIIDNTGEELHTVVKAEDDQTSFRDPVFDPDSQHIFYIRTGKDKAVIRSELNGKNPVSVSGQLPDLPGHALSDIDLSPNGGKLLVGLESRSSKRNAPKDRIYTIDLSTGAASLLKMAGSGAAWSPDGESIVFESTREKINYGCSSQGYCSADTRLYTMKPDGSGVKRLFPKAGRRNEVDPDWSPDGERITFTSNRNYMRQIYIAKPDGRCLGFLTNGNLESYTASWGPLFTSEGVGWPCGNRKMKPTIDIDKSHTREINGLPGLWLGPLLNGKAAGATPDADFWNEVSYDDCIRFAYSDCGLGVFMETEPACRAFPEKFRSYDAYPYKGVIRRRGALVLLYGPQKGPRITSIAVLSGGRFTPIEFYGLSPYGTPRPKAKYLKLVDRLRPFWETANTGGKLEPALIGEPALAHYRKIVRYSRTHDITETARRFDQGWTVTKYQIREGRRLLKLGVSGITCAQ